MFSILIPCLKKEFLESQLYWLSNQTFRDFNVVVMDGYYKEHHNQPFMQKSYPFNLIHVPLVENKLLAKRYDFSIKNNLAMLAPTFHFIFLSDTIYTPPDFAKAVYDHILATHDKHAIGVFNVNGTNGYDATNHSVLPMEDPCDKSIHYYPIILNKRDFIYLLNGFDEVGSYADLTHNSLWFLSRCVTIAPFKDVGSNLLHVNHKSTKFFWQKEPCDHCSIIFSEKALLENRDYDGFFNNLRLDADPDIGKQMTYFDKDLGCIMFQCGVCGFGGALVNKDYAVRYKSNIQAPISGLDERAGRDLIKVYELMTSKCDNNVEAKLAFLRSSY